MCKAVNELFADDMKAMEQEMKLIIASKDAEIADKDTLIAQLQAKLDEYAKMAAKPQS